MLSNFLLSIDLIGLSFSLTTYVEWVVPLVVDLLYTVFLHWEFLKSWANDISFPKPWQRPLYLDEAFISK